MNHIKMIVSYQLGMAANTHMPFYWSTLTTALNGIISETPAQSLCAWNGQTAPLQLSLHHQAQLK